MAKVDMPAQLLESIQAIVDYNWADEQSDFESWLNDEGLEAEEELAASEPPHHVFVHLSRVQQFLDQLAPKAS